MNFIKKISALAFVLAIPAIVQAQEYPSMTMRMASFNVNNIPATQAEQWWAAQIRERSGGKIRIMQFWAGSGGGHGEIPDLVGGGALQLGAFVQGNFSSKFPIWSAPNSLPGVFKTVDSVTPVLESLKALPSVQAELTRANLVPLWGHVLQPLHLFCTSPIRTVADFEGKLIRGFGAYQPRLWAVLGATGVTVESTEVYEGLQRGRFDCAFTGVDNASLQKLHEVAKYLNLDFGATAGWQIYMNRGVWEGMNEDTRKLFTEVSAEAEKRALEAQNVFTVEALETLKQHDVEVVEFQEHEQLKAKMPDMLDLWAADLAKDGLGAEAQEAVQVWRDNL